jgi:hypothetical protein
MHACQECPDLTFRLGIVPAHEARVVIVVCDTNVCVRDTHLLRKKGGPALIEFLRATKGQLLIPEILHQEYLDQFVEAALGAYNRADSGLSVLQTLLGRRLGHLLPSKDAFKQEALKRLQSLESLTRDAPLTDEIHLAAGKRVLLKKRPTSKSDHGYKDCLIWESVLRLPSGSDVRLVSRDVPAFFEGQQLAPELVEEAWALGITVKGYNVTADKSLAPLLQDLQTAHPLFDFSAREAFELEEPADSVAVAQVSAKAPLATTREPPTETPEMLASDVHEVAQLLGQAQKVFENLDLKILGYVAYLGGPGKEQLLRLLTQSGLPPGAARNVVERLMITGFVRDTGNHYLPVDRRIGEIAAGTVEGEIIELLAKEP